MSGVTKGTVDGAIHSLNAKVEELGLLGRFSMRYGSSTNGVQHVLEEAHPALSHPAATPVGRTLAEAYAYVLAMNHAFLVAVTDRRLRRGRAVLGMDPVNRTVFADPDSNAVRRAGEGV